MQRRLLVVAVAALVVASLPAASDALGGNTGTLPATALATVSRSPSGCATTNNNLWVSKRPDGSIQTALLRFDLGSLAQAEYVPNLVVLRLRSATTNAAPATENDDTGDLHLQQHGQVLVGRLQVVLVANDWDPETVTCDTMPQPIQRYEHPPRFLSGLAGEDMTANLENVVADMLSLGWTTMSILIQPEEEAQAADLAFDAEEQSVPLLEYHTEAPLSKPSMHQGPEDVEAGQRCEIGFSVPTKLENGTQLVNIADHPQGALVVRVQEGDEYGNEIPFKIAQEISHGDSPRSNFTLSFTPQTAGVARVNVLLFQTPIRGSPVNIIVRPGPISAAHCTSEATAEGFFGDDTGASALPLPVVGKETCFHGRTRDEFDNAVDGTLHSALVAKHMVREGSFRERVEAVALGYQKYCFTPPAPGKISLTVTAGDTPIPGFPVETEVKPGDTVATLADHLLLDSSSAVAGSELEFTVTSYDESMHPTYLASPVSVTVEGPAQVTPEVKTMPPQARELVTFMYSSSVRVSFTTTASGNYTVKCWQKGQITDSFDVTVVAATPNLTMSIFSDDRWQAIAGRVNQFLLLGRDTYNNAVTVGGLDLAVSASGPGPVETSVKDHGNGTYTISWQAEKSGVYSISVLSIEGQNTDLNIAGGDEDAFNVTLLPGPLDLGMTAILPAVAAEVLAGDWPMTSYLVERDSFGNVLLAHDPAFANVSVSLLQPLSGLSTLIELGSPESAWHELHAQQSTRIAGEYALVVRGPGGAEIGRHDVTVVPGHPSPFTSTVVHTFAVPVEAGNQVEFLVRMKDRFGNHLTQGGNKERLKAEAVHQGLPPLGCHIADNRDGSYSLAFEPKVAGRYSVYVWYQQIPLADSPFSTHVLPGPAFGPFSFAAGHGLHSAVAGFTQSFLVRARDVGSNDIAIGGASVEAFVQRHPDALSASSAREDLSVTDNSDGTFSSHFNLTEAGDYSLFIRVEGDDINGSPFALRVHPNSIGQKSYLDTAPIVEEPPTAGVPFTILFTAFDSFGNRRVVGGDDIQVHFLENNGGSTPASIGDNQNGTYNVSGWLIRSGKYYINASCDQQIFTRSTQGLELTVLPAANYPEHATIDGTGVHNATAGKTATFVLKMRDLYFNEAISGGESIIASLKQTALGVRMLTSRSIDVEVKDLNNGTYVFDYEPLVAGEYELRVLLERDGELRNVKGSPSIVTVFANRADAAFSSAYVEKRKVQAGSFVHYVLHTRDTWNNTCTKGGAQVKLEISGGTYNKTYTARVKDQHNGLYLIKVLPWQAGKFDVHITVNDKTIDDSNLSLTVLPAETYSEFSTMVVDTLYQIEAGIGTEFEVKTRDKFGNPTAGSDGLLHVAISSHKDMVLGNVSHNVGYVTATRAGPANLTVLWNHQHILNSPHPVFVVGTWTSALRTVVSGPGLQEAVAGVRSHFTVTPLDQYMNPSTKGPVNIEVLDPNGFQLSIDYEEDFDEYNVTYVASVTGLHEIRIGVGDFHLPNSPYVVLVRPGPTSGLMSQVVGGGIAEARVGHYNEFIIVARDSLGNLRSASGDQVRVLVTNKDEVAHMTNFDINDNGMGIYKVRYLAPAVEMSLVFSVLINGEYAGGRNFTVDVLVEPSEIGCPLDCGGHGLCNVKTGLCNCSHGWIGADCSVPHLECPMNCSGPMRGQCNVLSGICQCNKPYQGIGCQCDNATHCEGTSVPQLQLVPRCFLDCGGHGVCVAEDTCLCDPGYSGRGCTVRVEYELVPMEAGFVAAYEVQTGRLFGFSLALSNDLTCAGLVPLDEASPQLHNTSHVRRPPNLRHAHAGRNRLLEYDPETGATWLLSFADSDLDAHSLGSPTTHRMNDVPEFVGGKDLAYMGLNRLMISTGRETQVYTLDRESEDILIDEVTDHIWDERFRTGRVSYAGRNLVLRYTSAGHYSLFRYNRANADILEPPLFEEAFLRYVTDLSANNSLAVVAVADDVWLAYNPRTGNYWSYKCRLGGDDSGGGNGSGGAGGCTPLNRGSLLHGFGCPTIPPVRTCANLTVPDCIKSDRCGYCEATRTCMPGTSAGPIQGQACDHGWLFEADRFKKTFNYMGGNQVFEFDATLGKYNVWQLNRRPRERSCPLMHDVVATGFLAFRANQQVLFANGEMIVFTPSTGHLTIGSCNEARTIADCSLSCDTWASETLSALRFRRLAVIQEVPLVLLDFDPRSGDYRVWETVSRADLESGVPLMGAAAQYRGSLAALRDADVTSLSPSLIIAHRRVDGGTAFLALQGDNSLAVHSTAPGTLQTILLDGVEMLNQHAVASLGPQSLLVYTSLGNWQILECRHYPVFNDFFNGTAPVSCYTRSTGNILPPNCNSYQDAESCVANPACGWCESTRSCRVGYSGGICDASETNCPVEEWHYQGSVHHTDTRAEEEGGHHSLCASATSCKDCVTNSQCGWHAPTGMCVEGTPHSPANNSLQVDDPEEHWWFYYCKGELSLHRPLFPSRICCFACCLFFKKKYAGNR